MSVERYALDTGEMEVHRNGGYVLHTDYEELERYVRQADITIENLEQKLAESQREFRAADATSENLQMKLEKMAAENAVLLALMNEQAGSFSAALAEGFHDVVMESGSNQLIDIYQRRLQPAIQCIPPTPATDAFLAEVRASALPVEIAEIIDSGDLEAILYASGYSEAERYRMALYNFRTSRKGVQS
ncbi:TPA: hypothetical protein ACJIWO_000189 [Enterobacter cloacae]